MPDAISRLRLFGSLRLTAVILFAAAVPLVATVPFAASPIDTYLPVRLQSEVESYGVNAYSLNDHAEVVGTVNLDKKPVIWRPDGSYAFLPETQLPGRDRTSHTPRFIGNDGVIYGRLSGYDDGVSAPQSVGIALWTSPTATPTVLPNLTFNLDGATPTPRLFGANQSGQLLLGTGLNSYGFEGDVLRYDVASGSMVTLPPPAAPPGLDTKLVGLAGLSDAGDVFGNAVYVDGTGETVGGVFPVKWGSDAVPTPLTLPGLLPTDDLRLRDVSPNGHAVAELKTTGLLEGTNLTRDFAQPVRWGPGQTEGQRLTHLMSESLNGSHLVREYVGVEGYTSSFGSINDAGTVVAMSEVLYYYFDGDQRLVHSDYHEESSKLWIGDDRPVNAPGTYPYAINNAGDYLATLPEPSGRWTELYLADGKVTTTYIGPTNGDNSWDNPLNWSTGVVPDNWTGGGPTYVHIVPGTASTGGNVTIFDQHHTIERLFGGAWDSPSAKVQAGRDLRVNQRVNDIDVSLLGGADLIVGNGARVRGSGITGASLDGKTARLSLETTAPGQSFTLRNVQLIGTFGDTGPFVIDATGTDPGTASLRVLDSQSTLRGKTHLNLPTTVTYEATLLIDGSNGTAINAPVTVNDRYSDVTARGDWSFGPQGSIHVEQGELRLDYFAVENASALPPRGVAPLSLDLSRITFGPTATAYVRDSLTISLLQTLANRVPTLEIEQSVAHPDPFIYTGLPDDDPQPEPAPSVAFTATDLQGGTFNPATIFPSNVTGKTVLANGILIGDPGQPVVFDTASPRMSLWNMTVIGGIENNDSHVLNLSSTTLSGGTVHGEVSVGMSRSDFFDTPTTLLGETSFLAVTVAQDAHVTVHEEVQPLRIEGGLELNGTLTLGNYDNQGIGILKFVGTQTLDGTGIILADTMSPSSFDRTNSIQVQNGNLTIGPGIQIITALGSGTFVDAPGNQVNLQGELLLQSQLSSVPALSISADTFRIEGGGKLQVENGVDADINHFIVAPHATLDAPPLIGSDTNALNITGALELQGGLLQTESSVFSSPDLQELNARFVLISANNVTGTFDTVNLPTGNPPGTGWAVLYTATTIDLVVALAGDTNLDQQVEQGDLDAVLQNWGKNNFTDADADVSWVTGDLNGNGIVEQADLDLVLQNWGSAAAPDFQGSNVPEPAALSLLSLLALHRRRRA